MKKLLSVFLTLVVLSLLTLASGSAASAGADDPRRAFEGTTLNVLMKTGQEAEAPVSFYRDFEEATGIKVNVEVYDEDTTRNKFILDCTSKSGNYDVVSTQFWHMPEYNQTGWLEPLDDYMANKRDEGWYSLDNIPDSVHGMFKDEEGKLYATCVSATGGVLCYRTDLFEKHGIPAPKTTDDVLAAAAILKEKEPDIYPFAGRGDSTVASFGTPIGWAWGYGAKVFGDDHQVTIDTPEMKQGIDDYVKLMTEYGPPDAAAMGWASLSEVFRQGKIAMIFEMNGEVDTIARPEYSSVWDKVDIAVITGPAGNPLQWLYGEGVSISAFSKNKDAAWLFVQWRTSLDVLNKEVEEGFRVDYPDSRVSKTELYKQSVGHKTFYTDKIPDIMESIQAQYYPFHPKFEQIGEAFQQRMSLVIAGNMTVETALAESQAAAEEILK